MGKKRDRNINFILNAAILSLIIMAVLQAIEPLVAPPDPRQPEIVAHTKQLIPLRPVELEKKLHSTDGRPTMLVVYTTWCGYCRVLVPQIVDMMQQKKMDDVNVIMMSIDKTTTGLSTYIVHNDYVGTFTPYIIKPETSHELSGVLSMTGSTFRGGIPYMGFYNTVGKLVSEISGMASERAVLTELDKLKANHTLSQ